MARTQPMDSDRNATPLRSLELFTGAGGLALGTHYGGFHHSGLVEWNRDACDTLRENVAACAVPGIGNWEVVQGDVRDLSYSDFGSVDLIAGGPPCQPFSIGGKHRGMRDERDMIPEFVRAVREIRPRAFLFENVRGLTRKAFRGYFRYLRLQLAHPAVRKANGSTWEDHLARLEDVDGRGGREGLHYRVHSRILNAADFGVPQIRQRIFIVGFRNDFKTPWRFPEPTHSLERLLYDQWISREYWAKRNLAVPSGPPARLQAAIGRVSTLFPPPTKAWVTLRDAIADLPEPQPQGCEPEVLNHRFQPGARSYVGHTGSPLDSPAKALKAGVHGVPGGENMIVFDDESLRYLTIREAARVQTFPDEWHFLGAWSEAMRQLGNAVPVKLATRLGHSVAACLDPSDA